MRRAAFLPAIALVLAAVSVAWAGEPAYFGVWAIKWATVAPWADPTQPRDDKEKNSLIGKTISVGRGQIAGPDPFGCKPAKYRLVDSPPEGLFQGAFDEMRRRDASVDPAKVARSLGFAATTTKTLETGCEFDWHFVNPGEMKTGLNDWIYTLKKR